MTRAINLRELLAADPAIARRRKKSFAKLDAKAAKDVGHKMDKLRDRKQYQKSDVRFLGYQLKGVVDGTYVTTSRAHKRNKTPYVPDTTPHATIPITVTVAGIARGKFGGYDKSPTYYYNEYCAGRMTRQAFAAYVAVITLEVIRGEGN